MELHNGWAEEYLEVHAPHGCGGRQGGGFYAAYESLFEDFTTYLERLYPRLNHWEEPGVMDKMGSWAIECWEDQNLMTLCCQQNYLHQTSLSSLS
jgi:hypothetical protein